VFIILLSFFITKSSIKYQAILFLSIVLLFAVISFFESHIIFQISIPILIIVLFVLYNFISIKIYKAAILLFFIAAAFSLVFDTFVIIFGEKLNFGALFMIPSILVFFYCRKNEVNVNRFLGFVYFMYFISIILILIISVKTNVKNTLSNNNSNNIVNSVSIKVVEDSEGNNDKYYIGLVNVKNEDRVLQFVESPVNFNSSLNTKIATGLKIFEKYLEKLIIPYPMGFYYGYAYITPMQLNQLEAILSGLLFCIIIILCIYFL
jgi:hypothetical protein